MCGSFVIFFSSKWIAEESGGSKPTTQFLSIATSSSMGKATDELPIEHLTVNPPVVKMGESGQKSAFGTNYVKLKCKNSNLYQYRVDFEPPLDNVRYRMKLIKSIRDVTGPVSLFDGLTLFLPILLEKVNVSYFIQFNLQHIH